MRTILTYGTFDLLHIGHLRILVRAAACGDRLVVGVSSDEFCAEKGKAPAAPYDERAEIIEALGCVYAVFPETCWEQKADDIKAWSADLLVMGGDWFGAFDDLEAPAAYFSRTPGVSSTERRALLGHSK